jgi:trimeric autotransporter adhesin
MRSAFFGLKIAAALLLLGLTAALAGCGGGSNSSPTLTSLAVGPPDMSVVQGLTLQFAVTGIYSNGSRQDLTSTVTWSSANPRVAAVSNAAGTQGLASAVGPGSTTITATLGGVSGATTLTVTAATLVSIGVTPANPSIAAGLTHPFTATGTYTNHSVQNITGLVTWSSANPSVASISNAQGRNGLATLASPGSTTITATLGGISGMTPLTVTAATLASIDVMPANLSVAVGLTHQFTATGLYTDNSTHDLTASVVWSSSAASVATISNTSGTNGLAAMASPGSTTITATLGGISGMTPLTVTAAALASIGVTPANLSVVAGLKYQFTATGVYTDNSTHDLTALVVWSSSAATIATISNASGFTGLATALAPGPTTITAVLGSISGAATLTVTPATLVSIAVTPPNVSLAIGTDQQFTATGTYTDGSTQNLTTSATWTSSATTVAGISNAVGSYGLATALSQGSTTITAALGSVSASTILTVSSTRLVSIAVTPASPSIATDTDQQFTATGTFSDSSTQDLTAAVAWTSTHSTIASVSNAPGFNGLAAALSQGTTTITAALGSLSGSTMLTVTPAPLVSIAVTPANPSVANGTQQQFIATGTYADNSAQDLTPSVAWSSSGTTVATISNASGFNGLATTVGRGSTTITAALGSVSGTATLIVTSATLVSIAVTPINATIADGTNRQFAAIGTYTDNSTRNLTSSVTWTASDSTIASVSNAAGSNGLATALKLGSTSILAAANGITSPSVTLLVTAAQEYAYVANSGDGTVSQYTVGAGGTLTAMNAAVVQAGAGPDSISVDPTYRYAYVANSGDNTVSQFAIGVTGALTPMNPASVSAGNYPQFVTVDPSGSYVYAANSGDNTVSQYTIGIGGMLTAMTPASVATGNSPQSIAVDPTGRYLYVANNGDGTVSQYTIGMGGALAPMSSPTVTAGNFPQSLTVDPTGRFVYVANGYDNTITQYTVGAGGALTAMNPASVATDVDPEAITLDPTGRYAYVANEAGTVSQYSVGASGALAAMSPPTVQAGTSPQSVTVDLTGHSVYVANEGDNTLSQFVIGAGGALPATSSAIVATGSGPYSITTAY